MARKEKTYPNNPMFDDFRLELPVQQESAMQGEEPGFWSKLGNTGAAIWEGLTMAPGGIVDTIRDAWNGGEIDVNDREAIESRRRKDAEWDAYQREYEGKTFDGATGAMRSAPYSLGTMVASIISGIAAAPAGPVAAGAAAMGASGTMAYRATKQDFMNRLYDQTEQALGRAPTQEEWDNIAAEFDREATEYGLWEAGPEALSNFLMVKFLKPVFAAKSGIGAAAKGAAKTAGEELATETVTQKGQAAIDYGMGWRPDDPTWWEALKEIAPETLWQAGLLGAGGKAVHSAYNRLAQRKGEVEANADETQGGAATPALPEGQPVYALPEDQNRETGLGPIAMGNQQAQMDSGQPVDLVNTQQPQSPAYAPYNFPGIPEDQQPSRRGMAQGLAGQPEIENRQTQQDARPYEFPDITGQVDARQSGMATRPYEFPNITGQGDAIGGIGAAPVGAYNSNVQAQPYVFPNITPEATAQPVNPIPTQSQITNTQAAPRADTTKMAEQLGMPAPQAVPEAAMPEQQLPQLPQLPQAQTAPQRPLGGIPGFQNSVLQPAPVLAPASNDTVSDIELPANEGVENAGQEETSEQGTPGFQQRDGGSDVQLPDGNAGRPAGERTGESGEGSSAPQGEGRNKRKLKIPNRPDEGVSFEIREADDVQASHLPEAGFQKNPRYQLENERRYHDEPASRDDVLDHAKDLDPDMLMESIDASQGAPIIDRQGNVLGGNSRAMSIRYAYDKFPQRAEAYRQALKERAESLGIDSAQIDKMKSPMLVRSMDRDMDAQERQSMVSALNDTFTKSKDKRASGKSRGDRLSPRTIDALGRGLQEAESLREFFDQSESASVVEMLIRDGVIQSTERNAFVAEDGLLNPDGKKIVEEALRGRVAKSYEALDALSAAVVGKIDAAIPYVLIAENIGREWNITPHVQDAVDLVAEFQAGKSDTPQTFLNQLDMTKGGKAPAERYSMQAQTLFLMMLDAKKKEFAKAFERFAAQAKLSQGGLGVGLENDVAFDESFDGKRRDELIDMLPKEEVYNARRKMTNQQIRDRLKELQRQKKAEVNKDTEGQSKQRDNDPFGQAYPEYSGKGAEAIEYLLEVRQGYVPAAFNKEGIGKIDVPWGKDGKGGFGLAHIIERRNKDRQDGVQFVSRLPDIIKNGTVEKRENFPERLYVIAKEGNAEAVISLSYMGEERAWLLTGYEYKNTPLKRQPDDRLSTANLSDEQRIPSSRSKGAEDNISPQAPERNRNYGTIDNPDTVALGEYFFEQFATGKRYDNIGQARREAAQLLHGKNNITPAQFKAIDEAIELGVVKTARQTIADMRKDGKNDKEIFKSLVSLYQRQPNLSSRTSTSVEQQAYSTPAPIAFLASRLAGINNKITVYEPTAGNGMLLMEAAPQNATVNELNGDRASRLKSQGFEVTEQDATGFEPAKKTDVVIENPPFGRVRDNEYKGTVEFDIDGFNTKELDQAIVVKSLQTLKDNGRAVLVIGGKQGNDATRKAKYRAASQVQFWKYLSENYNIRDHFSIDGKMYARQGASYPIDVIVLDNQGKTEGYTFPGGKPPRVYSSFEQMEELLNGEMDSGRVSPGDAAAGEGRGTDRESDAAVRTDGRISAEDVSGRNRSGKQRTGESGRTDRDGQNNATSIEEQRTGELERSRRDSARSNGQETGSNRRDASGRTAAKQNNDVADVEGRDISIEAENMGRSGGTRQDGSHQLGGNDSAGLVEGQEEKPKKEKPLKPTRYQTPYQKASSLPSLGTLVPKNMATAIKNAFAAFKKEHGNIDKFVARELGYNEAELGNHFAAEQVDAIGLAISNLKKNAGFIIGDQTGIGKGRVNAAIIRWAKRNGKVPVFITMNPQLYGDMVRDLQDIGMPGFNPLTTNVLTGSDAIELPDGRKLKTKASPKHKQLLQQVMQNGLGEDYDAIFTTYNQLDSSGDNFRRRFMEAIAPRALFILDEAHNAGGTQGQQRKAKDAAPSRAQYVRDLLKSSPNGVFYSSATYAKRPDVMDLYMKTDMRHAVNDGESLGEAINRGGIPMQQIVAAQLAQSGQYLRRERTWEGADVETHSVKTDTKRADACADAMRAIMEFDRAKQEALGKLQDKEAGAGLNVGDNSAANESGMSSIGFSSIMHNLISQSTLSQKVDAIVDACDTAIKNGEKPVITLSNTMGSAIEEYADINQIAVGDPINITFEDMFMRYLEKTRTIVKTEGTGSRKKEIERRLLTDQELGPHAVALYNKAMETIRKSGVNQLPVSFIDMIEEGLRKRGISTGEITGRKVGIDYSGAVPVLARKSNTTSDKINTVNSFNSGSLDAVVLNSSGSTGISLHASEKFKDQRRRTMIVAQPDGNIDVFMQTLGRIFRTGQVVPPKYQLLFTDIPAEKRQAAVLARKMASLNANTSAAKDSDASFKNIPDFMNKYGDRVAMQIIKDNPALHEKMGSPLEKKDNSKGGDSIDGSMQKLTGYIPLLPVKEQKVIYDQLEAAYKDLTEQLEAMGALDLEAKPIPFDAKLINEEEITPKKDVEGTNSPFTAAAKLGKYDVKKLGKPLSLEKVKEMVADGNAIDPRDDRAAFDSWLKNKLKNISDKRRDDFRKRSEDNYDMLKALANTFKPGVPILIENKVDGQKIAGVVTNVSKKGKADNPVALGNYHVEIAVADAAKKLTFPFSQIADPSATNYSFEPNGVTLDEVYKAVEDGQSEGRESIYIATGNVLAAFERLEKGRVIVFEDHEGNLTPGLMLSKTTSISEILNDLDVTLTPRQAMDFLKKCSAKSAMVKTEDKVCAITRTGEDTFDMAVPASKARGGQYFLNGAILEASGKDFIKSGNSMVLRGLSRAKMQAVLDAMSGQNTGLIADNNKEVAREVSGQKQITTNSFSARPKNSAPANENNNASGKTNKTGYTRTITYEDQDGNRRTYTITNQRNGYTFDGYFVSQKGRNPLTGTTNITLYENGWNIASENAGKPRQFATIDEALREVREFARQLYLEEVSESDPGMASIRPGQFLPSRNANARGTNVSTVHKTVDALNRMARNTANTEVVQSFAELPKRLRDIYATNASSVEAVYDQRTEKVYFVADNISDSTRAAEVWAHEQIVHHGLRGMLNESERTGVMNQLWMSMGGMGNPLVKEIADRYGLKPRSSQQDRLTLMEEVVANLAEGKQFGNLSGQQESMWKKVVRAVARIWNKIVERVTGRQAIMGYEQVDNLLTALGRYVIDGIPAGGQRVETTGAMASVGEGQTNSYGVPMERITNIEGNISKEDVQAALLELAGKDLPNIIEGLTAQVNSNQRGKLISEKTRRKSREDGFTSSEHSIAAQKIANIWKWSAEMRGVGGSKEKAADVNIRRFVSSVRVKGRDAFAWLTVKETPKGLRIYSLQLMNNKKLREQVGNVDTDTSSNTPTQSFNEIIGRLKGPVNGADAPLASIGKDISEHIKSVFSSEAIAAGIRNLRKIAGRGISDDVQDILDNPDMGKLVRKDDISFWERCFKVPHWIAKDHKEAAGIYERQQQRTEERMAATNSDISKMSILFDQDKKNSLNDKEYKALAGMIHKWDGKEIPELKNVPKFRVKGKLSNGKSEYEINPEFRDKFGKWVQSQPEAPKVREAFEQIRTALDDAFVKAYTRMSKMEGIDPTELEKYRNEFGNIHNYFPHSRKGKYYVMATEGEGKDRKVVYRKHFDVPLGSSIREEWAKIVAEQQKNYPNAKWHNPGENEKLPDDILGAPIDPQAMEQIIKSAAGKIGDKQQAAEVSKLMLQGVADILKARGFGSHGIHRQNIAGYEMENIKEVLYDYFSGLNGWLTKMDAAADFTRMLGEIDARKQPRLWQYMSQYIKDMLRNSDNIDRVAGKIKTVAFAWYLGANLKTAVVNSTQNIIDGVPRLQQYVTGGAGRWLKAAADTIGMKYTGNGIKGARNLSSDEEKMLERLYGNGIISAAYMDELQGQLINSPVVKGWRKFVAVLGKPMGMVECFNRASLALAAYRAARNGAWRGYAIKELGLQPGQKMSAEQAEQFAAMLVRDSHFEYGKGNMPEIMRSTWAGRALSPMYTFRSFGANQLNLWYRALTKEGREGKIFVAKSLGATIALGGLASFPFFATLSTLCTAISGDDEDWQTKIKNQLPENDMVRDMVCYGLPAITGFSIAGSLRMETPFTDSFRKAKTFKDAMNDSIAGLIGIPYDLTVNRPNKYLEARKYGQDMKAIEALAPTFVSNLVQAYRMNTQGQTGKTGAPIIDKTTGKQNKFSMGEAIGKSLGFQPVSSARSYDDYQATQRAKEVRDDKLNELTMLFIKTLDGKGPQYRQQAIREMKEWNEKMKDKPGMNINLKQIRNRVNRRRPKKTNVA